ncbi:MAG: FAD-binding oxidoreductase [Chloroflexota bacterium]
MITQFGLPYWLDLDRPTYPTLDQNLTTDVAIIGAGISGLKMAHYLAQYGIHTIILEASQVGMGASGRNQGSINHGAGMHYAEAIRNYSRAEAQALWQLGLENHHLLKAQLTEYEITCDYEIEGYTYLVRRDIADWESQIAEYKADAQLLTEDGFAVRLLDAKTASQVGGNAVFVGGLSYQTDAQFHSGKYVLGLAEGIARLNTVQLFEGTRVEKVVRQNDAVQLYTTHGQISAAQVFLATNALAPQFAPHLEPGLRAERGQILVTEPISERPCQGSFGTDMAWWREILEPDGRYRFLLGGGRGRNEPDSLFPQFQADGQPHPKLSAGFQPSAAHQQRLETQLVTLFPQFQHLKITHRWGGLQSFTADNLPRIGTFDPERRIHGIAGLSGRGNCYSDIGAKFLAEQVAGVTGEIEVQFGDLIRKCLQVGRDEASWGDWHSPHD